MLIVMNEKLICFKNGNEKQNPVSVLEEKHINHIYSSSDGYYFITSLIINARTPIFRTSSCQRLLIKTCSDSSKKFFSRPFQPHLILFDVCRRRKQNIYNNGFGKRLHLKARFISTHSLVQLLSRLVRKSHT